MKVLSAAVDKVIKSVCLMAEFDFQFASDKLIPLIGRLEFQRELQNTRFYDRLAKDLVDGCIMPPITLAIIGDIDGISKLSTKEYEDFIGANLNNFFILDGMQRMNTLDRVLKSNEGIDLKTPIYANILVCPSMDHLLYRMITLNNGQKPMTARHQIEVITSTLYDFDNSPLPNQAEKMRPGEKRRRGYFKKVDLVKSYLAYLSSSINIDNDKIVQEKLDELIANKIMDSGVSEDGVEFDSVLNKIEEFTADPVMKRWFLSQNNMIGFCAAIRQSYSLIFSANVSDFRDVILTFEDAFSSLNFSKIKLGAVRRKAVMLCIENYKNFRVMDESQMLDEISMGI